MIQPTGRGVARLALAVALATGAGPSFAVRSVIDVAAISAINSASAAITGAIGSAAGAINGGLVAQTQSLTMTLKGIQSADAAAISRAAELTTDAVNRVASTTERTRAMARFGYTDPCSIPAAAAGMSETLRTASGGGSGYGRGGTRAGGVPNAGASSSMNKALDQAAGREPAPAPEIQAVVAAKGACETFASGGVRGAACQAAGFATANSGGHANADIMAATLLDGPQGTNLSPHKRYTVDATGKDALALAAFMRNIASPLNLRDLEKGELRTDEGRRYLALKDNYEARISLAERPMRRHIGMITANAKTIPVINQLLESGQGNFVAKYLSTAAPNWQTKGISSDEMMNLEVERRYMNLDWQARMAAASPEEVVREQLQLTALQNVLLWRLHQEQRETGVAIANLAAAQVRAEMIPQMRAQHQLATR